MHIECMCVCNNKINILFTVEMNAILFLSHCLMPVIYLQGSKGDRGVRGPPGRVGKVVSEHNIVKIDVKMELQL